MNLPPVLYTLFVRYTENNGDWEYRNPDEVFVDKIEEDWDTIEVRSGDHLNTLLQDFEDEKGSDFKYLSVNKI